MSKEASALPQLDKETRMDYEVVQSIGVVGEWRVEAISQDGDCFVTLFSGPDSRQRAEEYATFKLGGEASAPPSPVRLGEDDERA